MHGNSEWKPNDSDRIIYANRNVIICQRRVLDEATGQRCILIGSGSHLTGQLVPFDQCRPYWEPSAGDLVTIVAEWHPHHGQSGQVLKQKTITGPAINPEEPEQVMVLLLVQMDSGDRVEVQIPWLLPEITA